MLRIVNKKKNSHVDNCVFFLTDLSVWVDAEGLSCDEIRQRDVRWNKR